MHYLFFFLLGLTEDIKDVGKTNFVVQTPSSPTTPLLGL